MSTSRLEKFIYAICSMEVSDLPAPLSRIEILWNCLITGETPDFEPQSRNEQYLMAMLGLYELENLPTPISRGEKLLYKIAMGETDLSDVPGYLSRYEELLKYLIENGGVGDFEYILQTLNQRLNTLYSTKERPVKSAILKGNTLVNLCEGYTNHARASSEMWYDNAGTYRSYMTSKIKSNTTYTIIIEHLGNRLSVSQSNTYVENGNFPLNGILKNQEDNPIDTKRVFTVQTLDDANYLFITTFQNGSGIDSNVVIIEGDYTNVDIPYFTGMQSVKLPVLTTTGKNLYPYASELTINNPMTSKWYYTNGKEAKFGANCKRGDGGDWFYLEKGTYVYKSVEENVSVSIVLIGEGEVQHYSGNEIENGWYTFRFKTRTETVNYVKILNIQLEEGSTSTSYEPYKTNILTVNEDVTLRGIGDVRDTLDCLTGEVTERISEVVLVGSENWNINYQGNSDLITFSLNQFPTNIAEHSFNNCKNFLISDSLPIVTDYQNNKGILSHRIGGNHWVVITVNRSDLISEDVVGFKHFLSTNPVTIQYQLATESIKTVDLTTVDQDGQPTQLKTFNDITHVELSSEGLIPEVELEVATKINETLLTMSPQHHDISETQNKLGQTIDEQTENTDAAMLATTEIYEQTL